jgi:fluoroacetyl-CoA thioesterase
MLEVGLKGRAAQKVTDETTATAHGSGLLPVFATPALVALMERTCWESVAGSLPPGQGTVGTRLEIAHTAPTPVGMTVICESALVAVEGRKLTFSVKARDEKGPVGSGIHERFIVENERFMAKAREKLEG